MNAIKQSKTVRGQFAEKLVGYIVQHSLVTERELQQYIRSRYSTRDVKDMLTQSIGSGAIVRTPEGYAAPDRT